MRRAALAGAVAFALLAGTFLYNGVNSAWREPEFTARDGGSITPAANRTVRVMAFNAAKCRFYEGGAFTERAVVEAELDALAAAIADERCDLVFLSEVVFECGPQPLHQVEALVERTGFAWHASGENYSFGWPFFRVRSGNALLSNIPMRALETMQLTGARPFWNPTNNRRVLWCELVFEGESVLAGSIRNDSFDLANNLAQTQEIVAFIGERPALLAGDFNAEPHDASMLLLGDTQRFIGLTSEPATFPASAPRRRIDHVLAPRTWTLVEQHTRRIGSSDHLAVVAEFTRP